jgi:hypothetical protein
MDYMIDYLWRKSNPYIFGDVTGEILHQNFAFAGIYGARFIEEGNSGPSGRCLGLGLDACTVALRIDGISTEGLEFINTQLVTVDGVSGRYIETGSSFSDSAQLFNTACWSYIGSVETAVCVNNGQLELQNINMLIPGNETCYDINNSAELKVIGGTVMSYASDFHQIDSSAAASFIGNTINASDNQMPINTYNVTSIGNLKWK